VEGARRGVKRSGGRHPWVTAFAPNGPDDLPMLVPGKTRVGVPFCHMLEDHDPCDNMF